MSDVYARVTDRIVAQLDKGVLPWIQPWEGGLLHPLRANGVPYRGINNIMLWCDGVQKGFRCPTWMTFRQALELGGRVRYGETGSLVFYANRIIRRVQEEGGETTEDVIPFLKGYIVFNVAQIAGLPERFYLKPEKQRSPIQRIEHAERFLTETGAVVAEGTRPAYIPRHDEIRMPPISRFRDAESYYSTLAHELTHWSGHVSRLNRDFGTRWGDHSYAMEELVAELGSAFLAADLELSPEPREDHASYVASWLKVLRKDKRAIFAAASTAQQAADFIHSVVATRDSVNQAGTRNEQTSLALSRDSRELQSAAPQQEYA